MIEKGKWKRLQLYGQSRDENSKETMDKTPDRTADETIDRTAGERPEGAADRTMDREADETIGRRVDETVDKVTDETTGETVAETPDGTRYRTTDGNLNGNSVEDTEKKSDTDSGEYGKRQERPKGGGEPVKSSTYLIAREESEVERQKQLLYEVLGPVFFGRQEARDPQGLAVLFRTRYGIDVGDFYDGDEHYEEYQEACQAIAEGMSVYSGEIPFDDGALAVLAEHLWETLESQDKPRFRRINTMLEE